MTNDEQPSYYSRAPQDIFSPPVREPRTFPDQRETTASTLYTVLVGTCFVVVGASGLFDKPNVPGGAVGILLHDIVAVDPTRDALHAGVGIIGVAAGLVYRHHTYCILAGVMFSTLGVAGVIVDIWGLGSPSGLPSTSLIANWVYLILGVLAFSCLRLRQATSRDTRGG